MPLLPYPTRSTVALIAVGDPSRDRTVYATIVLLVALGFAMILLAVWLVRNTRPDPEVLAPLERMGDRRWRRADPVWQRRHLDEVRPGGADPLEPTSAPPATDADFERGPQPIGFDDLVASSLPTTAAVGGLPAPSGETQDLEGPLDVVDADEEPPGEVDATGTPPEGTAADDATSDGGTGLVDDGDMDDVPSADAAPDADAVAGGDDDDDITGEQDTDDFLAVLDQVHEFGPDVDRVVEPEADRVIEPEVEDHAEPEPEPDVEPEDDRDVQLGVEPEADSEVDHDAESEIDDEDDDEPG
ncbi:MAG TPA: hypothetical protein VFV63_19640 [Ilumatobacteraceae bacterium]|nr:hypothetical protein [Ilumatobacteraceae bacterium]